MPVIKYENFDLLVERLTQASAASAGAGGPSGQPGVVPSVPPEDTALPVDIQQFAASYRVIAQSAQGEARVNASISLSAQQWDRLRQWLEPRLHVRRLVNSPDEQAARELGAALYDSVFQPDVRALFHSSRDTARTRGNGLRIRLRVLGAPELADLPWEYLYDSANKQFLCLLQRTPLVRYLDLPEPVRKTEISLPLRILVVIANPRGDLNVKKEVKQLQKAIERLGKTGKAKMHILGGEYGPATLRCVRESLRAARVKGEDFHIFHFIGHGGFENSEGLLLFEGDEGGEAIVRGDDLGMTLSSYPLALAILNACEGARVSMDEPFTGTAQTLVKYGIPAVIGMRTEISDPAAICFAREFYSSIADASPVDAAITDARQALSSEQHQVEWGTPMLFLRSQTGELFDIKVTAAAVVLPTGELDTAEFTIRAVNELPTLEAPLGPVSFTSPFYVKRASDEEAVRLLTNGFLIIRGSGQTGKSSLVMRLDKDAKAAKKASAVLDVNEFPTDSSRSFYEQFCIELAERLKLQEKYGNVIQEIESLWRQPGRSCRQLCTSCMEKHILSRCGGGLLLIIERLDALLQFQTIRADFAGMMSAWQTRRASDEVWNRLQVALCTSVSCRHLCHGTGVEPPQVGLADMKDFDRNQVSSLNKLHSPSFPEEKVGDLYALTNGHPYLVRRALYEIASRNWTVDQFFSCAEFDGGPYDDHLLVLRDWMDAEPDRQAAYRQVLTEHRCPNIGILPELLAKGLINQAGPIVMPRCELYDKYFRRSLML